MTASIRIIAISFLVFLFPVFLCASSEAISTKGYSGEAPPWMQSFANPRPVYRYDWAFGFGVVELDNNGIWMNTSLTSYVAKSRGDGTAFTEIDTINSSQSYWTALGGQINGFSLSNPIGDWIDAFDSGKSVIRYSIREELGASLDNSDIVQIGDDEVEVLIKHGHPFPDEGVYDTLGMDSDGENGPVDVCYDLTALEWNVNFDDENLWFDHWNAINYSKYYRPIVNVQRNQDDETVYVTWGATADLNELGNLAGTTRADMDWTGGNYAFGQAHHADICYELRTYNPTRNPDGSESPYEWLYDASGDMYVPTDGSGLPTDTELERAFKLIGCHPYWVDDDTSGEIEPDVATKGDGYIWHNQRTDFGYREGVIAEGIFVDAWRLAGELLGNEFWNDDPDYHWDPDDGRVEDENNDAVAGCDALNNFMRYVFDIDALVVEDADDDGEFDNGSDYVLFSVVDDGLYDKYQQWGTTIDDDVDSFFGGEYFDGDTIFLYDGTSIVTFFDAEAGIFFGSAIDTATGYGTGVTLWSMYDIYDLDALDIGIINPEPPTLLLLAPALLGFAGLVRRRLK